MSFDKSGGIVWELDTTNKLLTIKPTLTPEGTFAVGEMPNYGTGAAPWGKITESGYSLVLVDGIINIGTWAFYMCSGFSGELSIPASVVKFAQGAFYQCNGFTNIRIYGDARTTADMEGSSFNIDKDHSTSHTIYTKDNWGAGVFKGDIINPTVFNFASTPSDWIIDGGIEYRKNTTTKLLEIRPTNTPQAGFTRGQMRDFSVPPWGYLTYDYAWTLTLYDGITNIGRCAFDNSSGITGTLSIPNTVTSIGNNAFNLCTGLSGNLTLPDGLTYIGDYSFHACGKFSGDLIIPGEVTYVGMYAFAYNPDFTSVKFLCGKVDTTKSQFDLNDSDPPRTYVAMSYGWVTSKELPDKYYTKWLFATLEDNSVRLKDGGQWYYGEAYYKTGGAWVEGVPRYKTSGKWE